MERILALGASFLNVDIHDMIFDLPQDGMGTYNTLSVNALVEASVIAASAVDDIVSGPKLEITVFRRTIQLTRVAICKHRGQQLRSNVSLNVDSHPRGPRPGNVECEFDYTHHVAV